MQLWQEGLLLLVVLWGCQAAGTWMQMRHYSAVMRRITETWPDGSVGASAARGTFGRGVIAIVVASPGLTVNQVLLMEGRSVFAKFREWPIEPGRPLASLADDEFAIAYKGRTKALAGAVKQIQATFSRNANGGRAGVEDSETTPPLHLGGIATQ